MRLLNVLFFVERFGGKFAVLLPPLLFWFDFLFPVVAAFYLPSWFHKLEILVSMAPVDMSVGTVGTYSVDIPRCWRDHIGIV